MNRLVHDIQGMTFGKLKVIKRDGSDKYSRAMWECRCQCGKVKSVRGTSLRRGMTTSCGACATLLPGGQRGRNTIHGRNHRHYRRWSSMLSRCYNPNTWNYPYYGGRGITVCSSWIECFDAFADWCDASGFKEGLTLDRIDPNGAYEPSNCRWATRKEQRMNQRHMKKAA